ncbi:MAG TPA: GTP-binding protein [Ramlibacter sp.]|nr:GTP-binding protein [Ramlibacter sp.]
MPVERIPVLLLTGGLGAGKTTLLASWLQQPELRDAAVVVNEIGEAAIDDQLLRPAMQALEGSALLAGTCVCCSGLPGLEQALGDLFRARLERRIPRFDRVVVETTGLAEPQPIRAALAGDPLLRERYRLEGVVTVVSATAPQALREREEMQAQVAGADLVVLAKVDRVEAAAVDQLARDLGTHAPRVAVVRSAQASLRARDMLAGLRAAPSSPPPGPAGQAHPHHHPRGHRHAAEAMFVPLPQPLARAAIARRLQRCIDALGDDLLRIKGVLVADDSLGVTVQWSIGNTEAVLAPFTGPLARPGLTLVATDRERAQAGAKLLA